MVGTLLGGLRTAASHHGISAKEYVTLKQSGMKWCTKGRHWVPVDNFHRDRGRSDGLFTSCKTCRKVVRNTKGRPSTFKGKKHSKEAKLKIGVASRGRRAMLGKRHSLKSRLKMSLTKRAKGTAVSGKDHHAFKDGKYSQREGIRKSRQYIRWRYDVFSRDEFTCQRCGDDTGGNLNAHHKKPFAKYPKLRFAIDNGITLCVDCHREEHYG